MEALREKMTVYMFPGKTQSDIVYSIKEQPGAQQVTIWLPAKHHSKVRQDGSRCIVCPDGSEVDDLNGGAYTGRPDICHVSPGTGKMNRCQCDVLDEATRMRVKAYRTTVPGRKPIWSIRKTRNAEMVPVYLPAWCKLVKDKESGKIAIQMPEADAGAIAIFSDGRKTVVPAEPILIEDFTGTGNDGVPFIQIGSKRKSCYLAEADDIYNPLPSSSKRINRMSEALWRIDTTQTDKNDGTSIIVRSFTAVNPQAT